jgi:hypothetical protein
LRASSEEKKSDDMNNRDNGDLEGIMEELKEQTSIVKKPVIE